MGFELRGHTILSYGEMIELTKQTREGAIVPAPLTAWFMYGERVAPRSLIMGFHKLAVDIVTDEGHETIARAVRRMDEALGRPEFCFDEMPEAEPGEIEVSLSGSVYEPKDD